MLQQYINNTLATINVRINYIDAYPEKAEIHMRAIQLTVIKQTTMDG